MSVRLIIENLSVHYGGLAALRDVSLSVEAGAVCALVGESGGGKTSLLRAIGGFVEVTKGTVTVADQVVVSPKTFMPPEKRDIGIVFQDYALFPHLNVLANVAFAKGDRSGAELLLKEAGLGGLGKRRIDELSGGQRQRVALARTLAQHPRLILLDEPFANLNQSLREELRDKTLDLLRERGVTTILVTHDPHEALALADQVAILQDGLLLQQGVPYSVYAEPKSLAVARATGPTVELDFTTSSPNLVETVLGEFNTVADTGDSHSHRLLIRPEDLSVEQDDTSDIKLTDLKRCGQFSRCTVVGRDGNIHHVNVRDCSTVAENTVRFVARRTKVLPILSQMQL